VKCHYGIGPAQVLQVERYGLLGQQMTVMDSLLKASSISTSNFCRWPYTVSSAGESRASPMTISMVAGESCKNVNFDDQPSEKSTTCGSIS
jgi:hypothetical protein